MRINQIRPLLIAALLLLGIMPTTAQSVYSLIERDPNFAAGDYSIYPESDLPQLTPAPKGYTPFYISHYGRHGSRYLSDMKGFKVPYTVLHEADSLGKLTPLGKMILREMRLNIADTEGRWGDLAEKGKHQLSRIAHRMIQNFPKVFSRGAFIDARSTIVTRCELSMGIAVQQFVKERPSLNVTMRNSYSDMWYMNHQDKTLRASATTRQTEQALNTFIGSRWHQENKISQLFNDTAYMHQHIDMIWFTYYLMKTALIQYNTLRSGEPNLLLQFFSNEDLYVFWEVENAWSYIQSGFCTLNGARQPYLQVYLLRQIINEADSIIASRQHGVSLRFGHGTILLPLTCLMGINGYDYRTDDLESLEPRGWWANKVSPMAGNIQIVFYRKNAKDRDPLVKVLVNEKEATLPLKTDIAPYYHWNDFRSYYLQLLNDYEKKKKKDGE